MKDSNSTPPKLAQQFLRWFVRDELREEVLGDLEEKFYHIYRTQSPRKAQLNYWYQVFHYLRPFAVRSSIFSFFNYTPMFKNSLTVAWRNIFRQKVYAAIKLGGFALGITACVLMGLFIIDEFSYDQHYQEKDRIFRLLNQYGSDRWTLTQAPVANILREEFPEVANAGRLVAIKWNEAGSNQIKVEGAEKSVYEEGFAYADQELVDILEIPMVYGKRSESLSQPRTILISERKANKFFPGENPVGRTIILNDQKELPYTVGGVMKNFPTNSHLPFDFFISLTDREFWEGEQTSWCCNNYSTYLLLNEGVDPEGFEEKLLSIVDSYYLPYLEAHQDAASVADAEKNSRYDLQPVTDIHLNKQQAGDFLNNSDIRYVKYLGLIACLILLLACINFINLTTAKSANRAKEIGLRKVIGSRRSQLIQHFLVESILYSTISFILGLLLAYLVLPYFNELAGKSLHIPISSWWFIPLILGCALIIGLIAGIYPAMYLSAFKPIQVLKGQISRGSKNSGFRSALVIFQFSVSIILMIGATTVQRQLNYILHKDLGYDKEQLVIIHGTQTLQEKLLIFKEEVSQLPDVSFATTTSYLPISETRRNGVQWNLKGRAKIDEGWYGQMWSGDHDYLSTLDIDIVEGRDFIQDMASDSQAIVINETLAKDFGGKEAIGKWIENGFTSHPYQVIGIMEDFHFETLFAPIGRIGLILSSNGENVVVKIREKDMKESLSSIQQLWEQFKPDQTFRYTFLDERYANMYQEVGQMRKISTSFAILAIVIACLGLFALSAFMAEQRRKEVSIRKVLGASSQQLFGLLIRHFLLLVVISLAIAIPVSWYLMQLFLELFSYKISLGWDIFMITSILILIIALTTVSYESLRTVKVNPIESLKVE